jgi:hypothetical protein
MRQSLVICAVALISSFSVSVAPAAEPGARWAWTAAKAEQVVMRDSRVRLSPSETASLETELRTSVRLYRGLELAAIEEGDGKAAIYHSLAYRYSRALTKVRDGFEIEDADCTGSRRASKGRRFKQFFCLVTSEVLQIPSAQLVDDADGTELPAVIEGPVRTVGPLLTQLGFRVTGKSTMAYIRP